MSEKKYRAWDKKEKEMKFDQDFIPIRVTSAGVFKLDPHIEENRWILIDRDRFELMKNIGCELVGIENLYVGDIVRLKCLEDAERETIYTGVITEEELYIGFRRLDEEAVLPLYEYRILEIERIGDIYQNPELIESA